MSHNAPEHNQELEATCKAIGADAGGTKLSLALSDGQRVWRDRRGSVNLRTETPSGFAARLAQQIRQALGEIPLSKDAGICVGAAGAGTDAIAMASRLSLAEELNLPPDRIVVTSDARIALEAAFGGQNGILIIAGTGSGCYGLDSDGRFLRAGGWGPGLEDPGSGSDLGRAAVKHLLSEMEADKAGEFSIAIARAMLPSAVAQAASSSSAPPMGSGAIPVILDTYYGPDFRPGSLAPLVLDLFEANNTVAVELVDAQCRALARQCARLADKMTEPPLERIAVTGGLANRAPYVQALSEALQTHFPQAHAQRMHGEPVDGALSWAQSIDQASR